MIVESCEFIRLLSIALALVDQAGQRLGLKHPVVARPASRAYEDHNGYALVHKPYALEQLFVKVVEDLLIQCAQSA